jgi:bacterioferritin-associated ferredoxin
MACIIHPVDDLTALPPAVGRAMTRCECTGITFEEAARRVAAERVSVEDLPRRTGCGGNCTACLPDLRRFLASRQR